MALFDFLEEEFWWLPQLGLPVRGRVGVALSRWTPPTDNPHFQRIQGLVDLEHLRDWAFCVYLVRLDRLSPSHQQSWQGYEVPSGDGMVND